MTNEEGLNRAPNGSSERARPDDEDPDRDSGNGDDLEHWLRVEDLLRQRRSNLLDFGLPSHLVKRPSP
jgi:hypothetical protein